MTNILFVGMDVHAQTIAVAVAEHNREVRSHGVVPNRGKSIRKLVANPGSATRLKLCYELGPTGYALYWQLTALGVACEVIAPSLIPRKPGERIKTDRREAAKDQLRARQRLAKFLLRHARRPPAGVEAWTKKYLE